MIAAVMLTGVVSCTDRGGTNTASQQGSVALGHVHGLGVDPGTGDLYAASHYGLFRFPQSGQPARVGPVQDVMGFTVVGPNHFLASGHPGPDQGGPSNVGLLESTDGGRSWQTLSLAGQADFHALTTSHGVIYGSNAGQLMVSPDGTTWQTRARIDMADLAASPQEPDTLLATTEQGLARSTDGGRAFGPVAGVPLLLLITWSDGASLIGLTPEGAVQVSEDGGTTWQQRGFAGAAPEALTASGDKVHAVVEGKIVSSDDGGHTFRTRYSVS
jgi:hypothetical protein